MQWSIFLWFFLISELDKSNLIPAERIYIDIELLWTKVVQLEAEETYLDYELMSQLWIAGVINETFWLIFETN